MHFQNKCFLYSNVFHLYACDLAPCFFYKNIEYGAFALKLVFKDVFFYFLNVHVRAGGLHNKTKKEIEKQSVIKKEAKLKDTEKPSGMKKKPKRLATLHSD